MRATRIRAVSVLLLTALLLSGVPAPPPAAHAQGQILNAVVGFINSIGALNRRNRVYSEARVTQREMDEYYASLVKEAQSQLTQRELMGTGSLTSEQRSQLRVYIKLINALRAEQQAVTQEIEAEKKQARSDFHHRAASEGMGIIVRSPGGQHLIGDTRNAVGGLRQAAQAVRQAMANNRPLEVLAQGLADKVHGIRPLQNVAYEVGSAAGHKLDQMLGGVITKVDQAMGNLQGGMEEAISEIDKVDSQLAQLQNTDRTPVSLVEEVADQGAIRGVDRANPAADVAAQAYTNAAVLSGAVRNPSSTDKSNMRDRIRQQLLQNHLSQLAQAAEHMTYVVCDSAGPTAYHDAMVELGRTPEQAADPQTAKYLICKDRESGVIIHAALIGAAAQASTVSDGDAEATEAATPSQPPPTEPAGLPEDRCSLSGEGDFMIESLVVKDASTTCGDLAYPFGHDYEPILGLFASSGKWVETASSPEATTWTWQTNGQINEGLSIHGTATSDGQYLQVDVGLGFGAATSAIPRPSRGGTLPLAMGLPLLPLALAVSMRRKRRLLAVAIALLSLMLIAPSCVPSAASVSGHYTFPIPDNGFACEVPPSEPNLAEMPGSTGEVSIYVAFTDEDGATQDCQMSATVSGTGVLKQDGIFTENPFQQSSN